MFLFKTINLIQGFDPVVTLAGINLLWNSSLYRYIFIFILVIIVFLLFLSTEMMERILVELFKR